MAQRRVWNGLNDDALATGQMQVRRLVIQASGGMGKRSLRFAHIAS